MPRLQQIVAISSAQLQGSPDIEISAIASFPNSANSSELAFVFADKATKALKLIKTSQAAALVLSTKLQSDESIKKFIREHSNTAFLFVDRPRYALSQIIVLFAKRPSVPEIGIHPSAVIDPSADIDPSARIGALVFVGPRSRIGAGVVLMPRLSIGAEVEIGADSVLHSGVVVEDRSLIGSRVIIHPNAVIGSDGFSYTTKEPSNLEKLKSSDFNFNMDRQIQNKILSIGQVIIEDDVEIGACSTIDRGTLGATRIGAGSKIDNLCQIAHNVEIGQDCLIIANTGIAGSAKIGDRVTIAGGAGVGDGVEMGNDSILGAYSATSSNVDPFTPMLGAPAVIYGEYMNRQRAYVRLPKLKDELSQLRKDFDELRQSLKGTECER